MKESGLVCNIGHFDTKSIWLAEAIRMGPIKPRWIMLIFDGKRINPARRRPAGDWAAAPAPKLS